MLTIGSLFSGIGGLELGLEWAGLGPVLWQCEVDHHCRSVLERHWPGVRRYEDVRSVTNAQRADLICGGFPCQDISSAGKGAGLAGERSGLWREFARVVAELAPAWVVVENVASGARRWVDDVCGELGQLGYATLPVPLSAQDVGAPHIRRRVFIVGHDAAGLEVAPDADRESLWQQLRRCGWEKWEGEAQPRQPRQPRGEGPAAPVADANEVRRYIRPWDRGDGARVAEPANGDGYPHQDNEPAQPEHGKVAGLRCMAGDPSPWATAPEFRGMDDGIPHRVDRLRALGNAVVPQCAEVIGWVIRELMTQDLKAEVR